MDNLEDITIQGDDEYYRAIGISRAISDEINFSYSELEKVTNEVEIVEIQKYINALNIRRLGLFKLITYYEDSLSNSKKEKVVYKARMGDTLPLIAQAFYGKSEYAEYLYEYNSLETINLEVNQAIEIPEIHPSNPNVYLEYFVDDLEAFNFLYGEI